MDIIQSNVSRVVVGLGLSGLSTMRYLQRSGLLFAAVDTRETVAGIDLIRRQFPDVNIVLGDAAEAIVNCADELYVSPGISLEHNWIRQAANNGARITGDLDLFSDAVTEPVIAITGTNGKSTVTDLVGEFAKASGVKAAVAGNIGTPMLDTVAPENECYVLELSSFQLERAEQLSADVACILNMSVDHIDHHGSMLKYHQAKQRIYRGAKTAVYNRDDDLTRPLARADLQEISFGRKARSPGEYGFAEIENKTHIVRDIEPLVAIDELQLRGQHNALNVMAALAIGEAAGFSLSAMLEVAKTYRGLEHRCREIARHNGVTFIDDSKATNVGSTLAAVEGLTPQLNGRLILIAGGQGKGADFSPLAEAFAGVDFYLILMGQDASLIEQAFVRTGLPEHCIARVDNMQSAVDCALKQAAAGDTVLLSPACASLDMFDNYQARGRAFANALTVRGLTMASRGDG